MNSANQARAFEAAQRGRDYEEGRVNGGGKKRRCKSKKQAWFLSKDGMPTSKVRAILRAQGKICLRCLSRPRIIKSRCGECWRERKEENRTRKR